MIYEHTYVQQFQKSETIVKQMLSYSQSLESSPTNLETEYIIEVQYSFILKVISLRNLQNVSSVL